MGSLTIVGTGLRFAADASLAACRCIEQADRVFYGVDDVATAAWIQGLNPRAESLMAKVEAGHDRLQAYERVVEILLEAVRAGEDVCAVFYGHPGFYVYPSHRAIAQAQAEGFPATMLAGISALDWLLADLGIDPSTRGGLQIHGAADWLLRERPRDTSTDLVLMQPGLLHVMTWRAEHERNDGPLRVLARELCVLYGPEHEAVHYVASTYPTVPARLDRLRLGELHRAALVAESTLYVPLRQPPSVDPEIRAELARTRGGTAAATDRA